MGPVEAAIRERIRRGKELHTPARKTRFVVDRIDDRGVVWARAALAHALNEATPV